MVVRYPRAGSMTVWRDALGGPPLRTPSAVWSAACTRLLTHMPPLIHTHHLVLVLQQVHQVEHYLLRVAQQHARHLLTHTPWLIHTHLLVLVLQQVHQVEHHLLRVAQQHAARLVVQQELVERERDLQGRGSRRPVGAGTSSAFAMGVQVVGLVGKGSTLIILRVLATM